MLRSYFVFSRLLLAASVRTQGAASSQLMHSSSKQASSSNLLWLEEAEQMPAEARKPFLRSVFALFETEKELAVQKKETEKVEAVQKKEAEKVEAVQKKETEKVEAVAQYISRLHELELQLERERRTASVAVMAQMVASGKLHMRGLLEYVFQRAKVEYSDHQVFQTKNPKPTAVWRMILDKNSELEANIVTATGWRRDDIPNQLTQLYSHLSSHIHLHFQVSQSKVEIMDEVVNPAQAGAMVCICDAYRVPYLRGSTMLPTISG